MPPPIKPITVTLRSQTSTTTFELPPTFTVTLGNWGGPTRDFSLPTSRVLSTSAYFRKELFHQDSPHRNRNPDGAIPFDHPDFAIFKMYVAWLNSGKIWPKSMFSALKPASEGNEEKSLEERARDGYTDYLEAYYLGQCVRDDAFKNSVMSTIVARMNSATGCPEQLVKALSASIVDMFWPYSPEGEQEGCAIKTLVYTAIMRWATKEQVMSFVGLRGKMEWPRRFVRGLLVFLHQAAQQKEKRKDDGEGKSQIFGVPPKETNMQPLGPFAAPTRGLWKESSHVSWPSSTESESEVTESERSMFSVPSTETEGYTDGTSCCSSSRVETTATPSLTADYISTTPSSTTIDTATSTSVSSGTASQGSGGRPLLSRMNTYITGNIPPPLGPDLTIAFRRNIRIANKDAHYYTTSAYRLQFTSAYFKNILRQTWEPVVPFTWHDEAAFERYLYWLETRVVLSKGLANPQGRPKTTVSDADRVKRLTLQEALDYSTLIDLYLLGHRVQDSLFKDTVMSFLCGTLGLPESDPVLFLSILTPSKIRHVWEFSEKDSALRRFVLESVATYAPQGVLARFFEPKYPVLFERSLQHRLSLSVPAFLLPVSLLSTLPKPVERILIPERPYTAEMLGTDRKLSEGGPLSCEEMVALATWVLNLEGKVGWEERERCRFHEHAPLERGGFCWWRDELDEVRGESGGHKGLGSGGVTELN
ncbi:hypothetical protein BDV96DRAFT_593106 [Lophiotrema nucula]|uniref:Uncharacterized protein n=1 Tax=Lophiotrema nucula TaxID=690887 RepID=A0A6A5ZS83_9PLEO|nr:hypothetical protein BDV96DRAFT_593106 [Lophiotrema nucula]